MKEHAPKFRNFYRPLMMAMVLLWAPPAAAEEWRELKDTHFFVYFTGDEKFARDALNKAEQYYESIASDLGYARYNEFWLWDQRCKIYIYPDHKSFLEKSGQPEWSHGEALFRSRKIVSYAWSEGFLDSLLPHEIAHLVFRDFVGFKGEVPLWLDEGVAQWAESSRRERMKKMVKELYDKDGLLAIKAMMNIDLRMAEVKDHISVHVAITKDGRPGVLFLGGVNLVNTYYLQAVSLVGFLIEKYGAETFAVFCRALREGASLEEALRSAYSPSMRTIQEFEDQWREYLDKGY